MARKRRKKSAKTRLREKRDARWSLAVRERDDYTCQICGRRGCRPKTGKSYKFDAHHLKTKGAHPKLRHVVDNGVTLCVRCHRWEEWQPHHNKAAFLARLEQTCPRAYKYLTDPANDTERTLPDLPQALPGDTNGGTTGDDGPGGPDSEPHETGHAEVRTQDTDTPDEETD